MRPRPHLPPRSPAAVLLPLLTAALLVLAGCSGGDPGAGPETGAGSVEPEPAPTPGATQSSYVAIGDSYTSAPFVPLTDLAGGCFRSDANYPSQVAEQLGATLTDVSCAGADTRNVRRAQVAGVPPQGRALAADTDLVTVSLGGNDGGVFSTLVGQCGRPGAATTSCARALTSADEDRLRARLERTGDDLVRVLRLVQRRSPDARVLAVGYPTIVSADRRCEALPLSPESQAVAARLNVVLNETVAAAAERAGATYVDVAAATAGHDICADDPWINGVVTDQERALAFHPFAAEQDAVAAAVLEAARG